VKRLIRIAGWRQYK